MSGLSARGFSPCSPGFRYSRRSARFRPAEPAQEQSPSDRGDRTDASACRLRRRALPRLRRLRSGSPRRFPAFWAAVRRPACASVRRSRASGISVRPQPRYFPRHSGRPAGPADIRAARSSSSEPGISPGIPLAPPPGAPSGVPTAPAAAPSEAAQIRSSGPVAAPQPGLADDYRTYVPPFLTPPDSC